MKTIKFFSMMLIAMVFSFGANAAKDANPTTKTESFKVAGNCGMCKSRIEKAAMIEGVSKASWDSKTQLLAVTYAPLKTSILKIEEKVAAVGHDTEKVKANDKVYESLPGCCKYKRLK